MDSQSMSESALLAACILGTMTGCPLVPNPNPIDEDGTGGLEAKPDEAEPDEAKPDCETLPDGAIGASYTFVTLVDEGNFSDWTASNLPPGLTIDPATGVISGVPEAPGNLDYDDITLAALDEGEPFEASCGTLSVHARLNANMVRGEPMHCIQHTASKAEMLELLDGGDESDITCSALNPGALPCPLGDGNGRPPPGITFNESSCTHSGNLTGNIRGTWVWMVEIEQSGFKTRVPFCASNDVDTFHDIRLTANAVNESDLEPGLLEFDPSMPLVFGNGSYEWKIDDPTCVGDPAQCSSYGFRFDVTCSPFDPPFVLNGMSTITGMSHQMEASGPTPSAGFATRPFVASFEMLYCTANNGAACDVNNANFDQNAQTNYHFDVVGYPVLGNL